MPLRHQYRGQRGAVDLRLPAEDLQAPGAHRTACRLGQAIVAGEDRVEPFLVQHRDRFREAEEQVRGRGVRKEPRGVGGEHRLPVPVGAHEACLLRGGEGPVAKRVEGEARRQHEALLGAGDGHVHPPLVMAVVHGGERGDGVDEEQRGMIFPVQGGTQRGHRRPDPGGSLVVDHAHRLDRPRAIAGEAFGRRLDVDTAAPVARHTLDDKAEALGERAPQQREVSGLEHQHPVTGREGVDQRRLPGPGARSRVDDDRSLGLEDAVEALQDVAHHCAEGRSAMVDGRPLDRPQDPIRHVGRPRDLQEVTAARFRHGACSPQGLPICSPSDDSLGIDPCFRRLLCSKRRIMAACPHECGSDRCARWRRLTGVVARRPGGIARHVAPLPIRAAR